MVRLGCHRRYCFVVGAEVTAIGRRGLLRLLLAVPCLRFLPAALGAASAVTWPVKMARTVPRLPQMWTPITSPGRYWDVVTRNTLGIPVMFERPLAPYARAWTRFHGYVEDRAGRPVAWITQVRPNEYYLSRVLKEFPNMPARPSPLVGQYNALFPKP